VEVPWKSGQPLNKLVVFVNQPFQSVVPAPLTWRLLMLLTTTCGGEGGGGVCDTDGAIKNAMKILCIIW
jgi:hypothetical protein